MATMVTIETNVVITQNGVTVVDRTFTQEYETQEKVEFSVFLDPANPSQTVCVRGTDLAAGGPGGAAIVDPMVLGLSSIHGFSLQNDINVELRFDSADDVLKVAEGEVTIGRMAANVIQIVRDDTRTGQVKMIAWGNR